MKALKMTKTQTDHAAAAISVSSTAQLGIPHAVAPQIKSGTSLWMSGGPNVSSIHGPVIAACHTHLRALARYPIVSPVSG